MNSYIVENKYRKIKQKVSKLENKVLELSKNTNSSRDDLMEAAQILQRVTQKMAIATARANKHLRV